MNRVSMPVIVGIVIVAVGVLIFSLTRTMRGGASAPTPATPAAPKGAKVQEPARNLPPSARLMRGGGAPAPGGR